MLHTYTGYISGHDPRAWCVCDATCRSSARVAPPQHSTARLTHSTYPLNVYSEQNVRALRSTENGRTTTVRPEPSIGTIQPAKQHLAVKCATAEHDRRNAVLNLPLVLCGCSYWFTIHAPLSSYSDGGYATTGDSKAQISRTCTRACMNLQSVTFAILSSGCSVIQSGTVPR